MERKKSRRREKEKWKEWNCARGNAWQCLRISIMTNARLCVVLGRCVCIWVCVLFQLGALRLSCKSTRCKSRQLWRLFSMYAIRIRKLAAVFCVLRELYLVSVTSRNSNMARKLQTHWDWKNRREWSNGKTYFCSVFFGGTFDSTPINRFVTKINTQRTDNRMERIF